MNSQISFALIGLGRYAESNYLNFLLANSNVRLEAICELPDRRERVNKLAPDIPFFTTVENMLDSSHIHAVIISTPHSLHFHQAKLCLDSGLDVFLDKPLGISSTEANQLLQISQRKGAIVFTALPRRYSIVNEKISRLISTGELGKIENIELIYFRSCYGDFRDSWRNDPENGGILFDAGYHIIDLLLTFSESDVASISCSADKKGFEVPTAATINVAFQNHSRAVLNLRLHPSPDSVYENYYIQGTRGVAIFSKIKSDNSHEKKEFIILKAGRIEVLPCEEKSTLDQIPLSKFIHLSQNREQNLSDLRHDVKIVEFIQEAYNNADVTD